MWLLPLLDVVVEARSVHALLASGWGKTLRAFFWLVSLLLSSLIWFIAVKASDPNDEQLQKGLLIFGVMFSVLLQEAFRFLYYKLLRAFFWLVSLLLSSLIWFIAVKASDPNDEQLQKGLLIFGVMFSVLLQEAFRFLYYKLLRAFFWLVSLLLSSLIWFIAVKASDPNDEQLQKGLLIFGVMFSVLLQEAFRFLYYKLLRKAIEGLVALSEDGCSPISIQQMAYVAGVGFGLMSGAFSMINLLADALGPGTVGIYGDSQLYFLTSAFMTMVLIFLHTFWGILFFHGCENRRWWEIAAVVVMHLAVSGSTFCNPLYVGSLVPSYVLMAVAATWAYLLSGGSAQNVRRFLLCLQSGASPQPGS
nr:PREDICTED: gamma-secretase subunit Aph-1b-like [Apteryx mantelli mantelli]